jgi:hypothetical protein
LWALTLKEQGSKESLPDQTNLESKSVDPDADSVDLTPCSFFHQPYYQPDSLPDRSPLAATLPEPTKPQALTSRSKTPTKLKGGGWERPMKSNKGEIGELGNSSFDTRPLKLSGEVPSSLSLYLSKCHPADNNFNPNV